VSQTSETDNKLLPTAQERNFRAELLRAIERSNARDGYALLFFNDKSWERSSLERILRVVEECGWRASTVYSGSSIGFVLFTPKRQREICVQTICADGRALTADEQERLIGVMRYQAFDLVEHSAHFLTFRKTFLDDKTVFFPSAPDGSDVKCIAIRTNTPSGYILSEEEEEQIIEELGKLNFSLVERNAEYLSFTSKS
jgi:hypothetical protein